MPKILTGKVISAKMAKTVTVEVESRHPHPLYRKIVRKTKKYKVHNESLEVKTGDWVKILETRPLSKDKHFKLMGIVEKGVRKTKH